MVDDDCVPSDLARLWRLPTTRRKGRPAGLDVDLVVSTAVDLADRDGFAAVSLQKVAATLGFTKMAMYRHVGSWDELIELMADAAIGPAPDLGDAALDEWRVGLTRWASELRAVLALHPWLAPTPDIGPARGPNTIAWMDVLLRVLRDTGLDWSEKLSVLLALTTHVRQAGTTTPRLIDMLLPHPGRDDSPRRRKPVPAALVGPDRFPEASKLFAATACTADIHDPQRAFEVGLELILDGVAARIAAARP
ncbi:TetR/AcrR family transcriptional regulator [Nocardia terpenica]|uniref:TetR/AcrR family transcriptional regulator n=1 Tax=Nocardia terpenica TaxID=455432 RepID=UPI000A8FE5DC|nr:TetR/AcrR family transcriptional regulator C-terminal domain-containing protein [Nocardia terpenica]